MRDPRMRRATDDYRNENVFELVEKPEEEFDKSPRYRSIHKERTKLEFARVKSSHKTLGQPKVPLNPPSEYLKKHSRIVPKLKVNHVHYRKPGYIHELPKWETVKPPEKPCLVPPLPKDPALVGRVNFRKRNVEDVKKYERKPQKFKTVDTRMGDVQELIPSGLMPIYIYKKNYGDVPKMLKPKGLRLPPSNKCNADNKSYTDRSERTSSSDQDSAKKSALKKPFCRYITEEERKNLLDDMQKKRAEMMKVFQCLPFLIDTAAKIKRKKTLETKLMQLEKDIELVENHQYIYVYND